MSPLDTDPPSDSGDAFAKRSLAGGCSTSTMSPIAPALPSTAMRYVCPAVAVNVRALVSSPAFASSLLATQDSPLTFVPWYTASSVSNVLPAVVMVIGPVAVAVYFHHTDL